MSDSYHHVFLPATDPASPALLLLHGTGGTENDLVPAARQLAPGAAILSPRGDVLEGGAARFFRRFGEGVFDLDDVQARTHALADFVVSATQRYGLNCERLFAFGFSNGANIAATLLQLRPEVLGGGALLLRPMVVLDQPAEPGSLTGRRVLLANGDQDPLVPIEHPAHLADLLRAGGAEVVRHTAAGAGHALTPGDFAAAQSFFALANH
jgi:phospholipase/carboxylesterase